MRRGPGPWLCVLALACAMPAVAWGEGYVSHRGAQAGEGIDRTQARVVTRDSPGLQRAPVRREALASPRREHVRIVHRRVLEPAATVSRELSEQPVRPHLAELEVVHTRVFVDPKQHLGRRTGGIDHNHSLHRAQRRWFDEQARPARVIRGLRPKASDEPRQSIRPRAIIPVPSGIERDEDPAPGQIPTVPRPPLNDRTPNLVQAD